MWLHDGSHAVIRNGCEISGCDIGVYAITRGFSNLWTSVASYIHGNASYGIAVTQGSGSYNTLANTYVVYGKKLDGTADVNGADLNIVKNTVSTDGSYIGDN